MEQRLIDANHFYNGLLDLYTKAQWGPREIHFSLLDMSMNLINEETADAVPMCVIDQLIEELKAEDDDSTHMLMHGIIVLEILKARWERIQNERGS